MNVNINDREKIDVNIKAFNGLSIETFIILPKRIVRDFVRKGFDLGKLYYRGSTENVKQSKIIQGTSSHWILHRDRQTLKYKVPTKIIQ